MGATTGTISFTCSQPADSSRWLVCSDRIDEQDYVGAEANDGAEAVFRRVATVDQEQVVMRFQDLFQPTDNSRPRAVVAA